MSNTTTPHNVAGVERVVSVAIGAALVTVGLKRRDTLGLASALLGAAFVRRGATGNCAVYQALGVSTGDSDMLLTGPRRSDVTGRSATVNARKAIRIEHSVTIEASRSELYSFWRDFTNLPQFMEHLESVTVQSPIRSQWTVKAPAGKTVHWDAEIINDIPNELIAWKTVGNPDVPNAGSVNFRDAAGGSGTVVRVEIDVETPGGKLGNLIAHLFGEDPDGQVRDDLGKFKQLMETGTGA